MPLPHPNVNSKLFHHLAPNPDPAKRDGASLAVVAAGNVLERAYLAIAETHDAQMANAMNTRATNLKRSADLADGVIKRLNEQLEGFIKTIEGEAIALSAKAHAPLTLPKEPGSNYSATAQQIRDYFRNLPPDQRQTRAMKAAQEGDTVTLGALLNAPGYLSGMDHVGGNTKFSQQQLLAQAYREYHFAPELQRIKALTQCLESINTGRDTVLRHNTELHPQAEIARTIKLDIAAKAAATKAEQFS